MTYVIHVKPCLRFRSHLEEGPQQKMCTWRKDVRIDKLTHQQINADVLCCPSQLCHLGLFNFFLLQLPLFYRLKYRVIISVKTELHLLLRNFYKCIF